MQKMHVHMVGIGGIGMSALAQLYQVRGVHVRGSDKSSSPVTELLARKKIEVVLGHDAKNVNKDTTLLVYSDAVPEDNPERVYAKENDIKEVSYFEALGVATASGTSIVISGTHGKTTTTAMLAKILMDTGKRPTVIAGSILSEHGSNFIAGRTDLYVIEGCEYRRHFLHLHPTVLVITNIELDHTDYFKNLEDMQDAFISEVKRVSENGVIITDTDSANVRPILIKTTARKVPYQNLSVPTLKVHGVYNKANAQAAKAAAYAFDPELHEADIDKALEEFTGTWRRFEYRGETPSGAIVYDDYAHHPTAVLQTLETIRKEHSDKRIVVVFHPHLYSRTRDFLNEFAEALSHADEVLLAPIFAAREAPITGITSALLAEIIQQLGTPAHAFDSLDAIYDTLTFSSSNLQPNTCILTMGAGDVYQIADALVAPKK